MSPMDAITEEAEIYIDDCSSEEEIYRINNRLYCVNYARNIVSIPVNDTIGQNKAIQFISLGFEMDAPYGCGYKMIRTELEEEKFALKVLAQDKDYDLCLMNSNRGDAYNIKENGVFYPLNEIPGVQEYLDACFPYVRDAATNQEGDIWMLPIGMDIASFLVNESNLNEYGITLENDMEYGDMVSLLEQMSQEQMDKISFNSYLLKMNFSMQYYHKFNQLDEDNFKKNVLYLKESYGYLPSGIDGSVDWREKDFLCYYIRQQNTYKTIQDYYATDIEMRFVSLPKLDSKDPNIGSCFFIAVNPNSNQLEDTLDYISSWIQYIMKSDDQPLFFKKDAIEAGTLEESLYQLYENAEIAFCIDEDLYEEGLVDVIENDADLDEYMVETNRKIEAYQKE